jgi:hypothetical protein
MFMGALSSTGGLGSGELSRGSYVHTRRRGCAQLNSRHSKGSLPREHRVEKDEKNNRGLSSGWTADRYDRRRVVRFRVVSV